MYLTRAFTRAARALSSSAVARTVLSMSDATLDWLLESDPAIRWQALRDLTSASPEEIATERARVPYEGWGARLLAEQLPNGDWGPDAQPGDAWRWNLSTLVQVRWFEPDPHDGKVASALALTREHTTWGAEFGDSPFFDGETEECINGQTLAVGAYFLQPVDALAAKLLHREQPDGGWNCRSDRGSTVSSFDSTIAVLEGLLLYERHGGVHAAAAAAARVRGEEYLLERGLFRRLRTGEVADEHYLDSGVTTYWRYDILRALDHFQRVGDAPDARISEALDVLESRRDAGGRWDVVEHEEIGHRHLAGEVGDDLARRWNTLRARRVLAWAGR